MSDFYILSLKWSQPANTLLTWWRADDKGYTPYLDAAGLYSAERVAHAQDYYNDGVSTLAVPREVAEAMVIRGVRNERDLIDQLRAAANPKVPA